MKYLTEDWVQEMAQMSCLPPLSPEVVANLLPSLEVQLRRVIQQATKVSKKSKSSTLRVNDINLALKIFKQEPIYGLALSSLNQQKDGNVRINDNSVQDIISIDKIPSYLLPARPLKPSYSLHWLAVNGVQPDIPQNPQIQEAKSDSFPSELSKDLQSLYSRITGICLNSNNFSSLSVVLDVLKKDLGVQILIPYFSQFFYIQIKQNTKRLNLLNNIIRCIHALLENNSVNLQNHLQQLLPAIFTCIVAPKLSENPFDDHWSLRRFAASVITLISKKYGEAFPDLQKRICKTYLDSFTQQNSLLTLYGGIVGTNALGYEIVEYFLLPNISMITDTLKRYEENLHHERPFGKTSAQESDLNKHRLEKKIEKYNEKQLNYLMCKEAIRNSLGNYIKSKMALPSLPWQKGKPKKLYSIEYPIFELEESLTIYYAIESKQLPYSRMVI